MPKANTKELHARATDLLTKMLSMPSDNRVAFLNQVLEQAELTDTELKRVHELARKACECRDKLAISLHTIQWQDPRQFVFDFDEIKPEDFE